jgi:hypothetical protein
MATRAARARRATTSAVDAEAIAIAIVQLADAVSAWVRHDLPSRKSAPLSAALRRVTSEERTAIREGIATLERLLKLPAPDPK